MGSGVAGTSISSCNLCMKMASLCSPVVKGRCSDKHISINQHDPPVSPSKKAFLAYFFFSTKKHTSALTSIAELVLSS